MWIGAFCPGVAEIERNVLSRLANLCRMFCPPRSLDKITYLKIILISQPKHNLLCCGCSKQLSQ